MKTDKILRRLRVAAIAVAAALTAGSCDDNEDRQLTFAGDSIIARWDLDEYFTGYVTTNLGQSGAGIDYIESLKGQLAGRQAVVMIGTNDMAGIPDTDTDIAQYVTRYVSAITALAAEHTYLYSILPRDFNGEASLLPKICRVNLLIRDAVDDRPDITYLDAYPLFIEDGHLDYELYSDRLHLSAAGYEVLAKILYPQL